MKYLEIKMLYNATWMRVLRTWRFATRVAFSTNLKTELLNVAIFCLQILCCVMFYDDAFKVLFLIYSTVALKGVT